MIAHLLLAILTYAALIFDAGCSNWSLPQGTAPQFLLMTAAIALLACDGGAAIVWAALIGGLSDVFASGPLGLNIVLLSNLAFFAQVIGIRALRESAFASGGMLWLFIALALAGSMSLKNLLHGESIDVAYLSQYAAGRAGGSVVVFLAVILGWRVLKSSVRAVLPSTRVGTGRKEWAT